METLEGITNASNRYFKDDQKSCFIWQKLLIFPCLWPLNELLNVGLVNFQKIRGPNSHVVFRSKKNFQELKLHQTLILFSEFCHMIRS